MFNRRKNQVKFPQMDTLIGVQTRIRGDVEFKGGLHLDGVIEGNVMSDQDTSSRLSISDSATVQGSINVSTVILNGLVQGDIVAPTRVDLGSTARVNGNVYYGLIEMAMGAQINGKLIHRSAVSNTSSDSKSAESAGLSPVVVEIGSTGKTKLG
jgi:cytoskeletal protein CcmA (bactofilin family)